MRDLGEGDGPRPPAEGRGGPWGSVAGAHLLGDDGLGQGAGRQKEGKADSLGCDANGGEDVRMECARELHGPVHGTTADDAKAGSGHMEGVMNTEPSFVGGRDDARISGECSLNNDGRGNGWSGPALGRFCMGPSQQNSPMDTECTHDVRRFAQAKINSLGVLGGVPIGAVKAASRPGGAWGKPAVVSLPSGPELGVNTVRDGRVQLDEEEVHATVKRFDVALVGRMFGKRISFEFLNSELHRRWDIFGSFRVVTIGGDCFVCFFDTVEGRDAVLMGGPWIIAGQVVGVDYWTPNFSPTSSAGFITPIWVRLPGLPMYCWGGKNVARIAAMLGEPIWMDAATDRLERGFFARACVRIDLSKPLRPGMWIDGPFGSFFQHVEYEGLSAFCFRCGHVGHKADGCKKSGDILPRPVRVATVELPEAPAVAAECTGQVSSSLAGSSLGQGIPDGSGKADGNRVEPTKEDAATNDEFGPWMLVSRKKKSQYNGAGARPSKVRNAGHVFGRQRLHANMGQALPSQVGGEKNHDGSLLLDGGRKGNAGMHSTTQARRAKNLNLAEPLSESGLVFSAKSSSKSGRGRQHKPATEREVGKSAPLKKRKQETHCDGGDASPLVN